MKRLLFLAAALLSSCLVRATAPAEAPTAVRERLSMDSGWRFAFGNDCDPARDFGFATGYFSYLAKAGFGDGPASPKFDDRGWRHVDLPNDWAVGLPFDGRGSYSHGFKAIGRNFPDTSVGWYRRSFTIPKSDLGRRISLVFDGVYRDSLVWVNGFYLGREPSGYTGFRYDVSDYLNYGGDNVVTVRVDATMEEGWFYEGAGIYRHVWLTKTGPLHVAPHGVFVTTTLGKNSAEVSVQTTLANESTSAAALSVEEQIRDASGRLLASSTSPATELKAGATGTASLHLAVGHPRLWSLDDPYLHTLVTTVRSGSRVVDRCSTSFGIRSIRFDPNHGFFLNGKHVELKGTNNHQDHAGVGTAIPDALQAFRIERLKAMGSNAYRCSHNPPTPELLDACDRLGMLVIDENRLMGTTPELLAPLRAMILRDRNHPSVILWSIGNEEWAIEGNETGARIAATMQDFVHRLDPTRPVTAAISGGWGYGISTVLDVMGYNYIAHGSTDEQHAKFPNQPGVGTEETTTQGTRGIYVDDLPRAHEAAVKDGSSKGNCEVGWKYYAARPYLAGLFFWTGFDYRGEATPFGWPAISSQFGILDTCGFPKDSFYYLKSWWTHSPVLHLQPHWNWPGREGKPITVRADSNCAQVELLLNGRSLGRKAMPRYGHLTWSVPYEPGTLLAHGYDAAGALVTTDRVETTGAPATVAAAADRTTLAADGRDVSVITLQTDDARGLEVPTASSEITLSLSGPGRIIGVGNGDPSSHEADVELPSVSTVDASGWRRLGVEDTANRPEVAATFDDSHWPAAFARHDAPEDQPPQAKALIHRGSLALTTLPIGTSYALLVQNLGASQEVYLNGRLLGARTANHSAIGGAFEIDPSLLHTGQNSVAIVSIPFAKDATHLVAENFTPAALRIRTPAPAWKRRLFNGLAQVIVQATRQPGEIVLTARSPGLAPAVLRLRSDQAAPPPEAAH